ncbi:hypothetical protein F5148DRAFT_368917 [Russula earlei]|uniref:Uncharacterized protein n=1 Tax=Russula earlei TaxID=71964 RepID=A0ACC0U2Y0_9AGAM|nr:hypothetical protein F5148DRAFT_368917 [Russula earlei]
MGVERERASLMSSSLSLSLEPTSLEYKRARRHHYKSTKNRAEGFDWTPFRAAEKKYKARFPPPDLSDVLDLALLDQARSSDVAQAGWKGRPDTVQIKEIGLKDARAKVARTRKAFTVSGIPGLVILPSFISEDTQRDLIRWSLSEHARQPNETNLDTHYCLPTSGLWSTYLRSPETIITPRASSSPNLSPDSPGRRHLISNTPASPAIFSLLVSTPKHPPAPSAHARPFNAGELLPRLRWANIGWSYHWATKQYDFSREVQPVGELFRKVCTEVVRSIRWHDIFGCHDTESLDGWGDDGPDWQTWEETYEPDAGIVNFYQTKHTLMGHVDRSEICATSPLVSISLGNAAIFLIGGLTREVVPIPILLRSGDIIVMSGPACRRAYHGVPRIFEGTLPAHLSEGTDTDDESWAPYARYMDTARININMRQVFPKGFDPGLEQT